jgi:hypothetical protein
MSVPRDMRQAIQDRLWKAADEICWLSLPATSKSKWYDNWCADPEIGVRLGRFMEARQVRHYIKDAMLKRYARERRADPSVAIRVLGLPQDVAIRERHIKPLGVELGDGRIVCWGHAKIWKSVLMALHERTFGHDGAKPFAAILTQTARFSSEEARAVVEDAAKKLGIERLVWLSDA